MTGRRITISDVANAAGVSKATVSYVLNNRRHGVRISQNTERKVLEVCRTLNYRPAAAAILLANRRKARLRLRVFSPWLYAQFSDLMHIFNRALQRRERETPLDISFRQYTRDELSRHLGAAAVRSCDAILILGSSPTDDRWLAAHADRLTSVVLLNRQVAGITSASGGDDAAMLELVRRIDVPHYRRVCAVVSGAFSSCQKLRQEGFAAGVAEAGGTVEELSEVTDTEDLWRRIASRLKAAERLLVYLPDFVMAARLMKRAQEEGVAIPEELGIVTCDRHSLLSPFLSPALTTMCPDLDRMSDTALELACRVAERRTPQTVVVPGTPMPGGTTVNRRKTA